ncbi:Uncharacterised protein [uncultured archaeon]|nr:Uncharacterised protein [uncultured archaeon]
MRFYVKSLELDFRDKYADKLVSVEGSIGVLEELINGNLKKKDKEQLEDGEFVFNNNNFIFLYDAVLDAIDLEERENGCSPYRAGLDMIDKKLDILTSDLRTDVRKIEEKKDKDSLGPHKSNQDYAKPVFHLPINFIDTMRVG